MNSEVSIPRLPELRKVVIVDDDEGTRRSWRSQIEDGNLEPILQDTPLHDSLDESVSLLRARADALLCDHHLTKKKPYAKFRGAEVVAASFDRGFPAILCSQYSEVDIQQIRPYRGKIPVLMSPDELDPDSLMRGFEYWFQERKGSVSAERRLHPVQVRVEDLDHDEDEPNRLRAIYVLVAGWSPRRVVKLQLSELPADVRRAFLEKPRRYLHASANIGARRLEDLYFSDWESE